VAASSQRTRSFDPNRSENSGSIGRVTTASSHARTKKSPNRSKCDSGFLAPDAPLATLAAGVEWNGDGFV
jgi:hypothetical protein